MDHVLLKTLGSISLIKGKRRNVYYYECRFSVVGLGSDEEESCTSVFLFRPDRRRSGVGGKEEGRY